jgi:hypothetical protein
MKLAKSPRVRFVAVPPPQDNFSEHGQLVRPTAKSIFEVPPEPEAPARSKTTQGDAAGNQIPKRHDRLDQLNPPVRELSFKFLPVSMKNNPRKGVIR